MEPLQTIYAIHGRSRSLGAFILSCSPPAQFSTLALCSAPIPIGTENSLPQEWQRYEKPEV